MAGPLPPGVDPSRIPRIGQMVPNPNQQRRLTLRERLTQQIANNEHQINRAKTVLAKLDANPELERDIEEIESLS